MRLLSDRRFTHIEKGRLKRVLADWCPPYCGYHLFYPSRRQSSAAFALVVNALRIAPQRRRRPDERDGAGGQGSYPGSL